jgi:hypothetical protein
LYEEFACPSSEIGSPGIPAILWAKAYEWIALKMHVEQLDDPEQMGRGLCSRSNVGESGDFGDAVVSFTLCHKDIVSRECGGHTHFRRKDGR